MKKYLFLLLFGFVSQYTAAQKAIPSEKADEAWKLIEIFESSDRFKGVSTDFDCQGMSIGAAQWNVGKSFSEVKSILLVGGESQLKQLMPQYGNNLIKALRGGREKTLLFVRNLQDIKNTNSCDATSRKATWSVAGKKFVAELKNVLAGELSIDLQKRLQMSIAQSSWRHAMLWAQKLRGENATPSTREFAYFIDMQNFNGGGLEKFGLSYELIQTVAAKKLINKAFEYMATANDDFLLNKIAARKNAHLLKNALLPESENSLFALAYKVSQKLTKPHARQFRLTVLNRRALILFGKAYISDRDKIPQTVSLGN